MLDVLDHHGEGKCSHYAPCQLVTTIGSSLFIALKFTSSKCWISLIIMEKVNAVIMLPANCLPLFAALYL
jgi:hypothetical protein